MDYSLTIRNLLPVSALKRQAAHWQRKGAYKSAVYMHLLYSIRHHFVDGILPLGLCDADKLLMTFPQIQQQAERRQPHLVDFHSEMSDAVINKSGKQLLICYPTTAFFESFSLSTFRFAPLNIASMMALLYSASSSGEVSSSTTSSVSGSFFSSGYFRL